MVSDFPKNFRIIVRFPNMSARKNENWRLRSIPKMITLRSLTARSLIVHPLPIRDNQFSSSRRRFPLTVTSFTKLSGVGDDLLGLRMSDPTMKTMSFLPSPTAFENRESIFAIPIVKFSYFFRSDRPILFSKSDIIAIIEYDTRTSIRRAHLLKLSLNFYWAF